MEISINFELTQSIFKLRKRRGRGLKELLFHTYRIIYTCRDNMVVTMKKIEKEGKEGKKEGWKWNVNMHIYQSYFDLLIFQF